MKKGTFDHFQVSANHNKSIDMEDVGIMVEDMDKSEIYEEIEGQSYRMLQEALHD